MLMQGKRSVILSERDQRQKCKQFRTAYKRSKERKAALRNLTTPPQSPDVERAMEMMPSPIKAVPSTMRIHQVISLAPGELMYCDVSCLCSIKKDLNCTCFNTQHFRFRQKGLAAPEQPANEEKTQPVDEIQLGNPGLLGQWCVEEYDDDLYLGIILGTDEMSVQVKCLRLVGPNRFFWPS